MYVRICVDDSCIIVSCYYVLYAIISYLHCIILKIILLLNCNAKITVVITKRYLDFFMSLVIHLAKNTLIAILLIL